MKVMLENMTDDVPLAAHERLLRESANIKKKYSDIFLKFADVHHGINHARAISPEEINQIGNLCFIFCFEKIYVGFIYFLHLVSATL